MKIKAVKVNNKKKCIQISVGTKIYSLPYACLDLKPSPHNRIKTILVDPELGERAVTYRLEHGEEDSIHLDAFLEYNKDPAYLRNMVLYGLTVDAIRILKKKKLSKHEIMRRLGTSPSQLYRLLDTTNYKKSTDEMLKLLCVLGCSVEVHVTEEAA
ncbi:MAG: hypothetical protein A2583_07220 [Bdellovibrionales bacterium RIFOXYD1_FULL_53_11]|nr:MAG: hypothetical protein A2583_07220 [Bdellovibrionales bacterium RIFOXYD1_FULL_53_11]